MKFRVGGWMIAIAFAALVVVRGVYLGVEHQAAIHELTSYTTQLLSLVIAVGLVLCASESTRWARVLFLIAALTRILPLYVEIGALEDWARISNTVVVAGSIVFAAAALARGAGKRVPWVMIPIAVWFAVAVAVRDGRALGFPIPLDLLSAMLALDLLAAFPTIPRATIPQATIHRPPHLQRLVVAISFAFIVAGGFLMWAGARELLERANPHALQLYYGGSCALAGMLGIWRLRRQVSLPIVVAIVFGQLAIVDGASRLLVPAVDQAALISRELPVVRIALPAGADQSRGFRDVGQLEVGASHRELDDVALAWGYLEEPEVDASAKGTVTAGEIVVSIAVVEDRARHHVAILWWRCGELRLRATVGSGAKHAETMLQTLATRIARTVECVPPVPTLAAVSIPVTVPSSYREIALEASPRNREFRGPDTAYFGTSWTTEASWKDLLDRPRGLFAWLNGPDDLRADEVHRSVLVIDGEYRWLGEIAVDNRRKLVAIFHCRDLGMYVIAGHDAPITSPLDKTLELVRSARCP